MQDLKAAPIFITGGCGMMGSHLVDHYYEKGMQVTATYFSSPTIRLEEVLDKANYLPCDVRDAELVNTIIHKYRPEIIYHLAAQSFPTVSWLRPQETMDTNAIGTINLLEAIKNVRKEMPGYDPVVIIACSSAEYGASLIPENLPAKEETPLLPLHPYGVSKVAQDFLGYQYFVNDRIRCIRARIFNTTGPRKINDVVSDFTKRAVLIEKGREKTLKVGTLKTRRAITDVRDLINALILLVEKGKAGEVYNISGEHIYEIQEVLTIIKKITGTDFIVETDPLLIRSSDETVISGDSTRLKNATGWKQKYTLETTIKDMIDYWRGRL